MLLVAVTNAVNNVQDISDMLRVSLSPGNDRVLRMRKLIVREISTTTEFKQGRTKETRGADGNV